MKRKKTLSKFLVLSLILGFISCGEASEAPDYSYSDSSFSQNDIVVADSSSATPVDNNSFKSIMANRYKKDLYFNYPNTQNFTEVTNSFKIKGDYIYGLGNNVFRFVYRSNKINIYYQKDSVLCSARQIEIGNKNYLLFTGKNEADNNIVLTNPNENYIFFGGDTLKYQRLRTPNKIIIEFDRPKSIWDLDEKTGLIDIGSQTFTFSNNDK